MDLKSSQTLAEALRRASVFLEEKGFDRELVRQYWLLTFDWSLTELVINLRQAVDIALLERFEAVLQRVVAGEPIQYILGYADFMGERFAVTPATLIPREDTAGLIVLANHYLAEHPQARVLDIGTGTGIIAITLAKHYPQARIEAVDISSEALAVAKDNQAQHATQVLFHESDVLSCFPPGTKFDLIISNPPYISEAERSLMDASVLKHEPHTALFADKNGLELYERIAKEARDHLAEDGLILLEIGFRQGQAVCDIFQREHPQAVIDVSQDLNGHDRYVSVNLKGGNKGAI
ncbi:peptide chain release factor N(5)-glutamine methyltransferase [Aerococcaceae bacterium NML201209]|nr:peptide chain release factor N(5)-glutamine methyltransferase [Aerococcaceae bacterium NML201209]MCW6667468.1 peptide chain release factor N(5)-glutamine methyltransferase [Aerococcaceae bacterium NML190938]